MVWWTEFFKHSHNNICVTCKGPSEEALQFLPWASGMFTISDAFF